MHRVNLCLFALLGLGTAALVAEQSSSAPTPTQEPGAAKPKPPTNPDRIPAYPTRPPADPAAVTRGRQVFSANCSFCHGSDARGGENGPNLIRSQLVLDDKDGELITAVVQSGRVSKGMPKFDLPAAEIVNIATFLHNIPVGGRAAITGVVDPVVGDAKAGEAYFNGAGKCSNCHSVSGDMAGIAGKYPDARALQSSMVSGEKRAEYPWKTVTVTLHNGQTVVGRLDQIDDFLVSLTDDSGNYHSYVRHGAEPKIVIKDPLQPHLDMLPTLKDEDIHNLTAYLETLK